LSSIRVPFLFGDGPLLDGKGLSPHGGRMPIDGNGPLLVKREPLLPVVAPLLLGSRPLPEIDGPRLTDNGPLPKDNGTVPKDNGPFRGRRGSGARFGGYCASTRAAFRLGDAAGHRPPSRT
jgi:hypothetical protein